MGSAMLDWRLSCLLVQAAALLLLSEGEKMCPASCRCEGKIVYCESGIFQDVPENITSNCQGLSLRYNNLLGLLPYQFAHLNQLIWLYLDHNSINTVDALAFNGVRRLKELILSSNKISHLHNNTFSFIHPGHFYGLRKLQNLHLRSNGLKQIFVRTFLECRSLEFLDLGYNRLRSLTRTTFLGLFKLKELHLEHNQFSRINFFLFPRLTNLQALYLQWNRIRSISQGERWIWQKLQKLDLSGNEIHTLDPWFFTASRGGSVGLDISHHHQFGGKLWDCRPSICPLMGWLLTIRDAKDISMICSGPKRAQGERVVDAIRNHSTCPDNVFSTTALLLLYASTTAKTPQAMQILTPPPVYHISTDRKTTKEPNAFTRTTLPFNPEPPTTSIPELQFEHMSFHKIIAGSVALFLSVSLILLVIYVSWRRYPNTMRQLQQHSVNHKKRKKTRKQSRI
ncbi:hypothetical protein WMY93_004808 [Mugilogobius chulae]|uniref:Leucine rich repeat transmembrane neuronal 4 like 2 n=1 Tax=Mugilogobius chulae TaxID=88201 RepID=A0AAW0PQQ8_9GOBI